LTIELLDEPIVELIGIEAPSEVKFNDDFIITAKIKKKSYSLPKNLMY